jgi:hypothetical protein
LNEEALAHWGAVAPENKKKREIKVTSSVVNTQTLTGLILDTLIVGSYMERALSCH